MYIFKQWRGLDGGGGRGMEVVKSWKFGCDHISYFNKKKMIFFFFHVFLPADKLLEALTRDPSHDSLLNRNQTRNMWLLVNRRLATCQGCCLYHGVFWHEHTKQTKMSYARRRDSLLFIPRATTPSVLSRPRSSDLFAWRYILTVTWADVGVRLML